ATH
ncbi:hypothetical protein ECEC1865_6121, partial [Escherichia coli EC1865]